ncbi:L-asparagine transporter-like permease [Orenia metallireducens]|jgi:amino acid transporter|uniref:L-asparagine transporter n=1 Tax=Orenia metallireducens TaxID=1413210 RepID=A0A285GBS5_9FIRM|nr:APC family permease [Orenia metallireducens]PRX32513.1 L-asparagine transporter-like permease [Orenia metallireducens]SNY21027.1 L-asparagine transporter [Orenia metallireducens]
MAEETDKQPELSRDLTLFQVTMMGVGMMIGAGVFVATGIAIGVSGPGGVLIAFILNGLLAFFSSMTYAELASAIPKAGGGYTYINEAFGGIIGFMGGWLSWFGHAISGSLYAITFAKYSSLLLEGINFFEKFSLNQNLFMRVTAVIIALVFVFINYKGSSETGNTSVYITLGKLSVLGLIGVAGIRAAFLQPDNFSNFSPFLPKGWGKILVTMGFTYIAFEGYEVIAQAGEETVNPKKNIPKAIFYSLVIVVSIYVIIAFATIIGVETGEIAVWKWFEQEGTTGFANAVKHLLPYGGIMVSVAALLSSTSALNATTYSSTRVAYAMGKNGSLPKKISKISKNSKTPHIALLLSSIIIVLVAATLPVEDVAAGADIMFLLIFMFVNLAVFKIRKEQGNELNYGYLMPYFPFVPIVAIIMQFILSIRLFDLSIIAWVTSGIWIGLGLLMYFIFQDKDEAKVN